MSSHDPPVPIFLVLELSLYGLAKLFMFVWVQEIQVQILSFVQQRLLPTEPFPCIPSSFSSFNFKAGSH